MTTTTAPAFSVQRLAPETVLESAELPGGRTIGVKSPKSVTYAVVDAQGKVVKTKNALTGKDQYEMYPTKRAAEGAAGFYNKIG